MEEFAEQLQYTYPRLAAKARLQNDEQSGMPVLLYPEGVVLLNETGVSIMRLCDGTRSFQEILGSLAEEYQASVDDLSEDVIYYLYNLYQQSLVELAEVGVSST